MRLGYEDWEFNIRLGANKNYGKRLSKPLFHYNVSNSGMLISKSSKYHSQIFNYIISKYPNIYNIRNLLKYWIKWRRSKSSYPLIIFLPLYLVMKIIPISLFSKLFVIGRNLKWFFTRNKFFYLFKKYLTL